MVQGRDPDWGPLLVAVGRTGAAEFMWMFEVKLEDGMSLQAYKHIDSRGYLHLGPDAEAFVFEEPHRYRPVDLECLVDLVRFRILMRRRYDALDGEGADDVDDR